MKEAESDTEFLLQSHATHPLKSSSAKAGSGTPAAGQAAVGGQTSGGQKPPLQDPAARYALSFVGADPFAEEYWFASINDPSLSGHERQDLIEDLNEDGLSDPQHPTQADLPLIVNRLLLLEAIAPNALDQVNADAFAEAYKDLANMVCDLPQR